MTVFSFFILFSIFYFCTKERRTSINEIYINVTALAIALEVMISIGYFIKIKGIDIGFSEVLIILDVAVCFLIIAKRQAINSVLFPKGMVLIIACVLSLFMQVIYPYNGGVVSAEANWDLYYFYGQYPEKITLGMNHFKEIIHVVCYVIVMTQFFSLNRSLKQRLLSQTFVCCKPFIWYGLFEFFMVKVMHAREILTNTQIAIFGNSYINDAGIISLGVEDRLRGLKSEPSMYGFALFTFFCLAVYLAITKKEKTQYRIYAVISFILMVFSKSFTAVVCSAIILVFGLLFVYEKGDDMTKKILIISMIIGFVFAFLLIWFFYKYSFESYYFKRIHLALVNMSDLSIDGWTGDYSSTDASTKVRMISIVGSLKYFLSRPLLGVGLGSTYAHSTMATMLASIGTFGTVAWYLFTFKYCHYKGMMYIIITLIWCVALVLLSNGLFPFYGIQNIIFASFFSLYSVEENRKKNSGISSDLA